MYIARRRLILPKNCSALVERKTFAHRLRPALLVTSISVTVDASAGCISLSSSQGDGTVVVPLRNGGAASSAFDPVDLDFQAVEPPMNGSRAMVGLIERAEYCGREPLNASMLENGCVARAQAAVVWTKVPLSLKVTPGCLPPAPACTFGFIASHASSLVGNTTRGTILGSTAAPSTPLDAAVAAYAAAVALPVWSLQAEHEQAWRELTDPSAGGSVTHKVEYRPPLFFKMVPKILICDVFCTLCTFGCCIILYPARSGAGCKKRLESKNNNKK